MEDFQLIMCLCSLCVAMAVAEAKFVNYKCSALKSSDTKVFHQNLEHVLESFHKTVGSSRGLGFVTKEEVSGADPVYGMAHCRNNKSPTNCQACIFEAEKQIRKCSNANASGGTAIGDGCFIRYENTNFYDPAQAAIATTPRVSTKTWIIVGGIVGGLGIVLALTYCLSYLSK